MGKLIGEDRVIEIFLDPVVQIDLQSTLRLRPAWILVTRATKPGIDRAAIEADTAGSCFLNEYPVSGSFNAAEVLWDMLGIFDDEYQHYRGIVVWGLRCDRELTGRLKMEGFTVVESTEASFTAALDQRTRDRLIGRA